MAPRRQPIWAGLLVLLALILGVGLARRGPAWWADAAASGRARGAGTMGNGSAAAVATAADANASATEGNAVASGTDGPGAGNAVAQAGTPAVAIYQLAAPLPAGTPSPLVARYDVPSTAEQVRRIAPLTGLDAAALGALRQGDRVWLVLFDGRAAEGVVNLVQRKADGQVLVGGALTDAGGSTVGSFSLGAGGSTALTTGGTGGVILPAAGELAYVIETGGDGRVYLVEKERTLVVCVGLPVAALPIFQARAAAEQAAAAAAVGGAGGTAEALTAPVLSSRPTAAAVIYLDFDGETVTDTKWNNGTTINASDSGLSTSQITEVWQRVAEDYLPFNVDVTTDVSRYNGAAVGSRTRCIITRSSGWYTNIYGPAGGVSYVSSWRNAGGQGYSSTIPCWAFADQLSGNARYIAEACAHEVGHTLGLSHDGLSDDGRYHSDGTHQNQEYYFGRGSGATSWAPIMGAGYDRNLVQWNNGDYADSATGLVANNKIDDDLAIISSASNHTGYMADDATDSNGTAAFITMTSGTAVDEVGLIERTGDGDRYAFSTGAGTVTFDLVAQVSGSAGSGLPDLNPQLTIYDGAGTVMADSNQTGSLYPHLSTSLAAGTYYLRVAGVGEGDPLVSGFSNYGSLGRYEITGTLITAAPTITSAGTASATVNTAFNYQIVATSTPTDYDATGLPDGLTVNPATGLISGKAMLAGSYSVTLSATNSAGTGTKTLTLTVNGSSITSAGTATATVNTSFSYQIVATGGPTSYDATGLPPGLAVNPTTGLISGTPTHAGIYSVALTATNPADTATKTLTLTVSGSTITSAGTATATVNTSFSYQIVATGGPTSYDATGLPSGLAINPDTGLISGRAMAAGVFSVTLTATNPADFATKILTLTVNGSAITSGGTATVTVNNSFSYQIVATGNPTGFNATGLSPGLILNPTAGLISGKPTLAGTYSIALTAINPADTATKTLTLTVSGSLTTAIDTTAVTVSSSGALAWREDAGLLSPQGVSAARSGAAGHAQESWMDLTVTGPGVLTFSWKVSSEEDHDFLRVLVDGVEQAAISGEADWAESFVTLATAGTHTVRFRYTKDAAGSAGADAGWVDDVSYLQSLDVVLDAPGLAWTSGGTQVWKVDTTTFHNGTSAARSGTTGNNQESWLELSFPGPGVLTFWWRVSSQLNADFLRVNLDGVEQARISGTGANTVWAQRTLVLGAGAHAVRWRFTKDASGSGGSSNIGWVDGISYTQPPVITGALAAGAVTGQPFSYAITAQNTPTAYTATGLPPGLALNAATGLISGTPTVAGDYTVTLGATNAAGTGNTTLALTVDTPFTLWAASIPLTGADAGPLADPGHTGLPNLLRYAFALNPAAPDVTQLPQTSLANDSGVPRVELTFTRPAGRDDVCYTVEVSGDLVTWTPGHVYGAGATANGPGLPTQEMERVALPDGGERIRVRDIAGGASGPRFIRVRVTQP